MRQVIVFNNKNVILPEPWVPPIDDRLRFEAVENTSISFSKYWNTNEKIQYSLDNGLNWNDADGYSRIYLSAGDVILYRGKLSGNKSTTKYTNFKFNSGNIKIKGNLMYLYDYENLNTSINYTKAFFYLFAANTIPIDASELIIPTVGDGSCQLMFLNCSGLTAAPKLQATTLANKCYFMMFYNCSSLNKITTYADNISASSCLSNWVSGVAATGDFYNLGSATYSSGASGIPTGWTEHTSL